ncbi:MAG: LexA repressor [Alphaproteobacteria bacterium ADurb.Bin438]|nr:MAG: LexA repressor [Alphaproteobacteria bacterium ADurb.Bin438]
MITKKQHELLIFIDKYIKENGISPSYDEMKDALNLQSKSGIHRLVLGLEERKFLKRLENRARAIEVIRLPEDVEKTKKPVAKIESIGGKPLYAPSNENSNIELPLYGKIAAGTPIEALRDNEATVSIPKDMIGLGDHYALTVAGDSMVEAGILDGDTVIIKRANFANNGSIVVALVDGFEVTLKTLRKKGAGVVLEPANPRYEARTFDAERVLIQGILVGLLRNYSFN